MSQRSKDSCVDHIILKNKLEDDTVKMNKIYDIIFRPLDSNKSSSSSFNINKINENDSVNKKNGNDKLLSFFKNRHLNMLDNSNDWYILPGVREFIIVDETTHRDVINYFQSHKSQSDNVDKSANKNGQDFYAYAVKDIVEFYTKTALSLFFAMGKKIDIINTKKLKQKIDHSICNRDWSFFKDLCLPIPLMIISNKIVTEITKSKFSYKYTSNSSNTIVSSDNKYKKYVMADMHKSQIKFVRSKLFNQNNKRKKLDLLILDFYKSITYFGDNKKR